MADLDYLLAQIENPSELGWRDETYDLAIARNLGPADRNTFEARLIDRGAQGDSRAILTLGNLGTVAALPMLRDACNRNVPWAGTARRAMTLLGRGEEVVDAIAQDVRTCAAAMGRVAAVLDLTKIGGDTAITALEFALQDEAYEVRSLAWEGLIATLGLEPLIRSPSGQREKTTHLELIGDFLLSDIEAFVELGANEMRTITQALRSGATPDSLGLQWISDPAPEVSMQILGAIADEETAYPVAAIAELQGVPRRWAEAALALRLDRDARVPSALADLAATWTLPVMESLAVAPATESAIRDQIALAMTRLRKLN